MKKIILLMIIFSFFTTTSFCITEAEIRKSLNNATTDELRGYYRKGQLALKNNPQPEGKLSKKSNIAGRELKDAIDIKTGEIALDILNKRFSQVNSKPIYLRAYKDGVITQSQFYKICTIYDEYSGMEAEIRSSDFIEGEGKEGAMRIWVELKIDEVKQAEQARVAMAGYPADYVLSNSDCEKIIDKYIYIWNTQGAEAGEKYASSFTAEQQKKLNERFLKRQQAQAMGSAIARGLAAAANAFNQNAQQMQQQSQPQEKYYIKDQYGMPKGSIEKRNF